MFSESIVSELAKKTDVNVDYDASKTENKPNLGIMTVTGQRFIK